MKIESSAALYTATSVTEKAAEEISAQPTAVPTTLQEDNVVLSSSGLTNTINSGNSGGELPPKKKDVE